MQTLTIELTNPKSLKALKDLEQKRLIRIVNTPSMPSYALPGEEISPEDFRQWIEYLEESSTISKSEAKERWTVQKKKIEKLIH